MPCNKYTYGNSEQFNVERSFFEEGQLKSEALWLERPSIVHNNYLAALDDINGTYGVIQDPITEKVFEVGLANQGSTWSHGIDAEISPLTTSLSGHPRVALEFAAHSAAHDRPRLLIARPGVGNSSDWDKVERVYLQCYGRFTYEDQPLPTLQAMARALKASDYLVTRLVASSAGAAVVTGLMSALDKNQITHACLKSRPNISNHPLPYAWAETMAAGDYIDKKIYLQVSDDPWKRTDQMRAEAKPSLNNLYAHGTPKRFRKDHALNRLLTDAKTFSHGSLEKADPAARDTVAALEHQQEAMMTLHFPYQDRLYSNPEDIKRFVNQIYFLGKSVTNLAADQVEVLQTPGGHVSLSCYPALSWAIERYAFHR